MEEPFIMAYNRTLSDWMYDEDFLDIYCLFQDVDPDLYRLCSTQCDESRSPEVGCYEANAELYHEHMMEFSSTIPMYNMHVVHEHVQRPDSPSMIDFDPLKFLNLGGYDASGRTCSVPTLNNSNSPCLQWTSGNSFEELHDMNHVEECVDHMEPLQRDRRIDFVSVTHDDDDRSSARQQRSLGVDVNAGAIECSPSNHNNNTTTTNHRRADGNEIVDLTATARVFKGHTLQCPRCHSLDTKFCYFNNSNRNQPRHLCRGCEKQWTVGGSLRPRRPKSPFGGPVRRKRGRETDQIAENGDESGFEGPEDQTTGSGNSTSGNRRRRNRKKRFVTSPADTHVVIPFETEGKWRISADASPVYASASELSFLKYSLGLGESSTSGAFIPSLDFSQLPSIAALRNNGHFLQSHVVPLASNYVKNEAIRIALQNARSRMSTDKLGLTPTPAPSSVSELRKRYGLFTVNLLHKVKGRSFGALDSNPLKTPPNFQFQDICRGFEHECIPTGTRQDGSGRPYT